MIQCEKFAMEGNEAAESLAKDGADLDGGAMATMKAATAWHEIMELHAAPQDAATFFHCQVGIWHGCEALTPKAKETCTFVDQDEENG